MVCPEKNLNNMMESGNMNENTKQKDEPLLIDDSCLYPKDKSKKSEE